MNYTLFYMNCFHGQMNDTYFRFRFYTLSLQNWISVSNYSFSIDFLAFTWLYLKI